MPVDGFTNASGAQAVQTFELDEGGKDMYSVITISDWDEKVEDVSFIFFIPLWALLLLVPVSEPLVAVCFPVFIGFFKVNCIHLALCQSLSSLVEYLQLLLIVAANFLMLLSNSNQPLGDVEEFFPPGGTVAFESSTQRLRGELQLTELIGGHTTSKGTERQSCL